jgi:cation:H+ antiporter
MLKAFFPPKEDGVPMQIFLHSLIIIASCGALWLGANWLVDSAARIARKFGISDLVIGLTVVAFGTSAPEFAVTVGAAIDGHSDMAMGNVIGSNVFNIGFILGIVAIFMRVIIKQTLVWRDGMVLLVTMGLLLIFLWNGKLDRWEGILFVVGLACYLLFLFWKKEVAIEEEFSHAPATWKDGPLFLIGLVLIVGGGEFLKNSAIVIARDLGMSEFLISMTVVAAGTSVPELAISMIAIIKKFHGISAGNLIGSNIFNTLGVLGVAGAIKPLSVGSGEVSIIAAQLGLTAIVLVFMKTGHRLVRSEGIALLIISCCIWGYTIKTGMGN